MRHANQQPATAYDYRRTILLVQALAGDYNPSDILPYLCQQWGIRPVWGVGGLNIWATMQALAAAREERGA